MNILVAGGAGFLGANLCTRLITEGHSVLCTDNLQTGRMENLTELMEHKNFLFYKGDVKDINKLKPMSYDPYDLDQIYNLACPASPPHYQAAPIETMMTCVLGTKNLLELARFTKTPMLQASTSEVYGDPAVHPQTEDYLGNVNPIGPRACYDEGKRAAEALCMDYRRVFNVDSKIVRIFNTYGPGMDPKDGRVVSNFIMQALRNEPLTIYGTGAQTRSFCYVDDLISGLIRMMNSTQTGPINLGNPNEFRVGTLASEICGLTNSTSQIVHKPLPIDDPLLRCPDISRARNFLGWQPSVALHDGLMQTIEYFRSYV
jgi:UDP-glucuronate decarboxylase